MSLPKDCPVGPRKRRSKKGSEAPVIRDCLRYLHDCSDVVYYERRNSGAVQFQDGGFLRFGRKGAADMWCLVRDPEWPFERGSVVHVEVECKRADGKGRQSEAQKEFQEFCDSHHIPYILTTSALDLAEKIAAIVLDTSSLFGYTGECNDETPISYKHCRL